MVYYAEVIQKLRKELDLPPVNFSHLDIDEAIKKDKSNKGKNNLDNSKQALDTYTKSLCLANQSVNQLSKLGVYVTIYQ